MPRRAFAYRITLADVGLDVPAFRRAPAPVRREVLGWLVVIGLREKDRDLSAGLDKNGRPLAPIRPATRLRRESDMGPADPSAPPLMPAYAASRTRLLLTGAVGRSLEYVEFWWEFDAHTGGSWGRILDYHRRGIGKSRTKRDVIGISAAAVARARQDVLGRWFEYQASGFTRKPTRAPAPTPPPPRLAAVGGRTDWHNFTFGIGGGGAPAPGVRTTGFFQRRPGGGYAAIGGPGPGRR